jgi:uncharacterized protein YndB with AHSA1/START domain
MRVAAIIIGGLVAVIVVIVAIGYLLPQGHVATRERTYRATPDAVFAAITTPASYPEWRSGVKKVEMLPSVGGKTSFKESGSDGDITFVIDEAVPPRRVVSRIADKSLPFGGSWTYELAPAAEGTRLSITENGEVYNPLFRFMSRFVFGHTATIDKYMDDLERRVATASR